MLQPKRRCTYVTASCGREPVPLQVLSPTSSIRCIHTGEIVGLVGESGSRKSAIARAILELAPVTSGSIEFDGGEISHATYRERRLLGDDTARGIAMCPPMAVMNACLKVDNYRNSSPPENYERQAGL
jgi:ABC-type dipeptide/oligopeptide/nickel transport system ATPase component